jgi:hypothetical protein
MDAADRVALLSEPFAVVAVMDTMTALTAAGAIASVIIKPLNWHMMASFCLVVRYCIGFSKLRTGRDGSAFRHWPIGQTPRVKRSAASPSPADFQITDPYERT